jgi:hypothetical protein
MELHHASSPINPRQYSRGYATADGHAELLGYVVTRSLCQIFCGAVYSPSFMKKIKNFFINRSGLFSTAKTDHDKQTGFNFATIPL